MRPRSGWSSAEKRQLLSRPIARELDGGLSVVPGDRLAAERALPGRVRG
ncbi:hypothetical protein LTT66_24610 [Nocardia gipuzkoensis]|nr:hypothetical protein [Nocardia gipuzkoensis]UGT66448.1 hypothetical protein LTT66_24610 [Nocardia gipuzkoensis]